MWKLRPLAIIDFHYDNKKVQENPKTPHPIVFSLFVYPKKKKNFLKLATLNII